ncbi:MAG TPA: hypothetical protein DF613_14825 [Lachnospiraceae bacterium]|nr:hypothetical protein [Lachnospiraceae bacterium]
MVEEPLRCEERWRSMRKSGVCMLLLIGLLFFAPCTVHAAVPFVVRNGVLEKYNGTQTHVVVPNGVKTIDVKVFAGKKVVEVELPSTVTAVRANAFAECNELEKVVIPGADVMIASNAFTGCGNVEICGAASPAVFGALAEQYRDTVAGIAEEQGMGAYTDLIMDVLMLESAGRGVDVMQCKAGRYSREYPKTSANEFRKPEDSIECGIRELKYGMSLWPVNGPGDLENFKVILQGYNFGMAGYIRYLQTNGYSGWTEANAAAYAKRYCKGRKYTDKNSIARLGQWRYGCSWYPMHVLKYHVSLSREFAGRNGMAFRELEKANTYPVTYTLNGGKNSTFNASSYTGYIDVELLEPTRKGYLFSGWYSDADLTERVECISGNGSRVRVYAKWTKPQIGAAGISRVAAKSKTLVIRLKTLKSVSGYQVMAATDSKFRINKVSASTGIGKNEVTLNKLKRGKVYYLRARGWCLDSTGKKVYGAWSKAVKKRVK